MLTGCCEGVLVPDFGGITCDRCTGVGNLGTGGMGVDSVGSGAIGAIGSGATLSRGTGNDGRGGSGASVSCGSFDGGRGGSLDWAIDGFIIGKPFVPLSEAPTKLVCSRLALVK